MTEPVNEREEETLQLASMAWYDRELRTERVRLKSERWRQSSVRQSERKREEERASDLELGLGLGSVARRAVSLILS